MGASGPHYEVREADDGSFYYVLVGGNGEVLSASETYTRREDAERGVEDAKDASEAAAEVQGGAEDS